MTLHTDGMVVGKVWRDIGNEDAPEQKVYDEI